MAVKKQREGNMNKPGIINPEGLASCDQPASAASHLLISPEPLTIAVQLGF